MRAVHQIFYQEEKMKGMVKWYDPKKRYGFITGEDGADYFLHGSTIPAGMRLHEEDPVEFDPVESDRGKQAQNIKKIEGEVSQQNSE